MKNNKILIIHYNNARPAVIPDVHFRHKMFSILDGPTPCLPEEQNRRYRDATLYLSNMRFWSKSQGVGPSKIENIL